MTKLTNVGLAQMAVEPADDDRLYIVDDVTGTPTSKYIEYSDLAVNLAKLDGTSNTWAGTHYVTGYILKPAVNDVMVIGGSSTSTTGGSIALYGQSHASAASVIQFRVASAEKMRVTAAGLVGINDSNPGAQLQVNASGATTVAIIASSYSGATAATMTLEQNGTTAVEMMPGGSRHIALKTAAFDNSTGYGTYIHLDRNSNGSTPAAASVGLAKNNGAMTYYWTDASTNFRVHTSPPTFAADLSGTVVGTQTSHKITKNILGDAMPPSDALAIICDTPVYEFTYKSDIRAEPQKYYGITTDDSPLFGWDNGKAFNPVNANGITIQAIKALVERVANLESQLQGA